MSTRLDGAEWVGQQLKVNKTGPNENSKSLYGGRGRRNYSDLNFLSLIHQHLVEVN
ncbi:hypothetical protein [cyanobacterium endosymbiont of Rhopalodia gibberula]|uniref:hypothetical protein n=1 Tax=cyanobacterium endosymbiont of Rhopalodia gibberula TaxID=1763363 RepID=UPI0015588F97|nr:hypothetical protein [cyanobacterium endosymbiont of Rhopalodia gibberula]